MKKNIPSDTIKRLIYYLRYLEELKEKGKDMISSNEINISLNIPSNQFRKDISYFGKFGKRGVGYNVTNLIEEIKKIIGIDKKIKVILIGVGRLGSALIKYRGFLTLNMEIIGAFDNDPKKIGKEINGIKIMNLNELKNFVKKENVKVCILTVPANNAQQVALIAVESGIKGILNFAPVKLKLPKNIFINNVDMASELGYLIFKLKNL